jgi:HAE1 family hydrophobic/amphiphilic exporter-1
VGTAVVGGMLVSTILNLFFIPVLYVLLKSFLGLFKRKKKAQDLPPCPEPAA